MTDKQLIQQLKSLKSINLSADTKKNNRDVLFSQISNTTTVKGRNLTIKSLFNFKNVFSLVSQPLLIVAGVFVFLTGTLILGSGFFKNSKPNDSLYIARIISEKARLNTTFSQSERDSLSLKFASDHAKDIATVLMDPDFNTEKNKEEVEKLSANFINEMSKVKNKIEKTESSNEVKNNDDIVSVASSLKNDNGVEIYIPTPEDIKQDLTKVSDDSSSSINNNSTTTSSNIIEDNKNSEINLKSLEEKIDDSSEKLAEVKNGQKIIAEIEKLFVEGKYSEVILKLSEIEKIIK